MKFHDTLNKNRVLVLNDKSYYDSVFTLTRRSLKINKGIPNLQFLKFFTSEEAILIIKYCNAKGFKNNRENEPSIIRIRNSQFANILEKRLVMLGVLPSVFSVTIPDLDKKFNFAFSRVHPVITAVMQLPGEKPTHYKPDPPLSPNEKIVWTFQGYLDCLGKGMTIICNNDFKQIELLKNQVNGSLLMIDSSRTKLKESISIDTKYYIYFDVIYVNTTDTKMLKN